MAHSATRRAIIASRIFAPEPSAASFRLEALARALHSHGFETTVLTTRYREARSAVEGGVDVRRARVLRDSSGYVRGYFNYLSFDVPLFFRLLVAKRPAFVVVEPPPTTGTVVRILCALRRIPYVAYAPDLWSDAMDAMDSPSLVKRVVRWMERKTYQSSSLALSVLPGITQRLEKWIEPSRIATVGNGIDTSTFSPSGKKQAVDGTYLLYAGTASEFQGATIFLDAFELIAERHAHLRVVFVGQGSDFDLIRERAAARGDDRILVVDRVSPTEASMWFRGARAALVSIKPGQNYDFAIPTKIYASLASGVPVIFAGVGDAAHLIRENELGWVASFDAASVAEAMNSAVERPEQFDEARRLADWAEHNASLSAVASRAVRAIEQQVRLD